MPEKYRLLQIGKKTAPKPVLSTDIHAHRDRVRAAMIRASTGSVLPFRSAETQRSAKTA
jgi:hypothetical protein